MKVLKLIILSLLLFPLSAYAEQNGIMVDCPSDIKEKEEFTCLITGYTDFEVSAIEYEFAISNNLEKVAFIIDPIWEGSELDNVVLLYTDENKKEKFNIGKIILKSKENINNPNIETKKLSFGDKNFNEVIIIKKDVNNVKSEKEKEITKKNNYFKYVIIILIISMICFFLLLYKK